MLTMSACAVGFLSVVAAIFSLMVVRGCGG
jgi:hypothetical protein